SRDFETGVELGGAGAFAAAWSARPEARAKLGWLAAADLSEALLGASAVTRAAIDEEQLALKPASVDLIVSPLALHWTNDLPRALVEIRTALKPDGAFLGALFGGRTLTELRECLTAAEVEITGGAAARVSPMVRLEDAAGLLQHAGFAMPVADADAREVLYETPFDLLADLRAMGETAAFADPAPPLRRDVLARMAELYAERHGTDGGRIRATFEIIHLHGWAPHPDQPTPKKPGSATVRLADALGAEEKPAGEKTGPARSQS
ncbi:MAG: methyltransferase domain-containing protein, partial [Maricaulaceae bacterium]